LVEGTAPLTPIQRWFFEQDRADLQHYNMALLLEVSPSVDPTLLARALGVVERQHDALRLRFKKEGETWVQAHVAPGEAIRLVVRELPSAAELGPALSELHQSLGLDEGPVFAALLARLSDGTARLALVAHHLVVDGVSWGPILEDLLLAYAALARGEEPKLPAKTTSFKQWSEQLTAYAETPRAKTELDAWLSALDREGRTTLPLIEASASDTVGEASTIATWLSPDETKALLTEAPKALDVKVQEVLIAALARALAGWCNQSSARIDVEGHGRELFEDLDLSRTVGWFTALYPLLVRVGAKESARETLARVKDGLRRIPNGGVGFGVLRYLSPDDSVRARLAALPRAEVAFNYLGQLGQIPAHSVVLGAAKEGLGPLHAPRARRPHRLEINAVVTAEGLRVNWTFGAEVFTAEAIERLSASFISNLRGLLKDSAEPAAAAVRVGADFPAARVSNKDLQKLLNRTRTPRS
jgi:non-ribosomal peptide synthase protein (TIGR01720 family)